MSQDKELNEKIIKYHGFTIGRIWKIVEKFEKIRCDHDKLLQNEAFKRIGEESYCNHKEIINNFLKEKGFLN
ncbi:MAG TPA: hypothetical protein VNK44_05780 [Candidatus Nitrosotenuis sp.]|nr:hypothetical protein [Candidatus Nitrosotenuis sp.]